MFARWTSQLVKRSEYEADTRPRSAANQASTSAGQQAQGKEHVSGAEPPDEDLDQRKAQSKSAGNYSREAYLRTPAPDRWNAAVKPRSQAFRQVVTMFEEKLNEDGSTIDDILAKYFTPHERDLLSPADRRRNRVLARIQRRNRVRYRMLLKSRWFNLWTNQATSTALKLAMLWFGLPVSPMELNPDDEYDSASDTADDIAEAETEKRREEAARVQNSLRFLNSYGQRHFGRDHLRGWFSFRIRSLPFM